MLILINEFIEDSVLQMYTFEKNLLDTPQKRLPDEKKVVLFDTITTYSTGQILIRVFKKLTMSLY